MDLWNYLDPKKEMGLLQEYHDDGSLVFYVDDNRDEVVDWLKQDPRITTAIMTVATDRNLISEADTAEAESIYSQLKDGTAHEFLANEKAISIVANAWEKLGLDITW